MPTSRVGNKPFAVGYSLIELLVAVSILATLAAVATPRLERAVARVNFETSAQRLTTLMRGAHRAAVASQTDRVVKFDLNEKRFCDAGCATSIKFEPDVALTIVAADRELQGSAQGAIRFYADGSTSGGQVIVTRAGRRIVLDINWLTGRVQRYADKS
jgi:general secretion pathway protein H